MLLCLDVGNTHIVAGLFEGEDLVLRFRYATDKMGTSDQFGLFLRSILQTHDIDRKRVRAVSMSSVVPSVNFTIRHALSSYFPDADYVALQAGVKTGINIKYKNPSEVGADLIAGAIGAVRAFPQKNVVIVDLGTATTLAVVSEKADFLGGTIMPGMRMGMESLRSNTAKLMAVDIQETPNYLGQSTRECIQRGLFFGHLGAIKEIVAGYRQELFNGEDVVVIGTGGFAHLFKDKDVFTVILPDLVLQGLRIAYLENAKEAEERLAV